MHIDLAASIREVLDNMEPVSINALGTLQLKHIPAFFSDKGTTLSPPTMVLDVKDNITPNAPLIKTISSNYGITKDAAKELINTFNKKLLNNLLNYKKVYIDGVAVITRADNGKVDIETTNGSVSAYYKDLPKITIIPNIKVQTSPQDEALEPIVPVVAVDGDSTSEVSIVPDHGSNGIDSINEVIEPSSAEQDVISQKQEVIAPLFSQPKLEAKTIISPQETKTIVPPIIAPTSSQPTVPVPQYVVQEKKPSLLWPLILLSAILLVILLCYRTCIHYAFNNDNISPDSKMTITEVDVLDGVTATDSISAQALTELRNDNSIIPVSGMCKIITGVFSRTTNVLNMRDKVRDAGYQVYSESYGEYTRVGLEFNCNDDTDLEAFLQEVRRVIAPKAWYLDPSLYVDYID